MDETRSFYVTLPSGSSMNIYPDNTLTQFSTWLHHALHLKGLWEVALVEFCFPKTFYNVTGNPAIHLSLPESSIHKMYLSPGFYPDPPSLIQAMNRQMKHALQDLNVSSSPSLFYRPSDNRVRTVPGEWGDSSEPVYPHFSPDLAEILGFSLNQNSPGNEEIGYGKKEVDLVGALHTLFVECDLCAPSFCGDGYIPLLRTVRVPPGNYGENACIPFNPPLYVPLARHQFQSIAVYIKDAQGHPIQFQRGRVLLTLHFRSQT